MKRFVLMALLAFGLVFTSKAHYYEWTKNIGGTGYDLGRSITVDAAGNVYVLGSFQGVADLDPGPGTVNLTTSGLIDVFIAKYDPGGNYLWANKIGGTGYDDPGSLAVDASGNVYVTGSFTQNITLGTTTLTSAGDRDIFLVKYNGNGGILWAKGMGGPDDDLAYSLALDGSGNIYLTGHYSETVDFDPGAATANLTSAGDWDAFFAKYDTNGNYIWAKSISGTDGQAGVSISVDGSGNVYVTGFLYASADLDPGPATAYLSSSGSSDIFFAKYDNNGNYLWARKIGGPGNDHGSAQVVDASGNVYITGRFTGTLDLDPGPGVANLSSAGGLDIFFAKYDAAGNYVWAKSVGGNDNDGSAAIALDAWNNVYITGNFVGTADFDPGAGTVNLVSAGGLDLFFAKYDPVGNFVWARSTGGPGSDLSYSIALDVFGNVYMTGIFAGNVDFVPNATTGHMISSGNSDVFFTKYYHAPTPLPLAPTALNLSASASPLSVTVNWTDNSVNETGFKVERSADGVTFTEIASLGMNVTTYVDNTVAANTTYYYRVYAYNTTGNSDVSNTEMITTPSPLTPPGAPGALTAAVSASPLSIDLNWTDHAINETGFSLERSTDGVNFVEIQDLASDITEAHDLNVNPNTTYHYRVYAYNAAGNSDRSNTVTVTTITTGVRSINIQHLTSVYPNPANNTLYLETVAPIDLKVVDLLGRTVAEQKIYEGKNSIDIRKLTNGIYFLYGRNGGTWRFIKE